MCYYIWTNKYELGLVKAENIEEAKQKVIASQGTCKHIEPIHAEEFNEHDVLTLVS